MSDRDIRELERALADAPWDEEARRRLVAERRRLDPEAGDFGDEAQRLLDQASVELELRGPAGERVPVEATMRTAASAGSPESIRSPLALVASVVRQARELEGGVARGGITVSGRTANGLVRTVVIFAATTSNRRDAWLSLGISARRTLSPSENLDDAVRAAWPNRGGRGPLDTFRRWAFEALDPRIVRVKADVALRWAATAV